MGPDAIIFVFWMLSFRPTFSLSTFNFIKRRFSSSSLSAIRVVSSAYLRLLLFQDSKTSVLHSHSCMLSIFTWSSSGNTDSWVNLLESNIILSTFHILIPHLITTLIPPTQIKKLRNKDVKDVAWLSSYTLAPRPPSPVPILLTGVMDCLSECYLTLLATQDNFFWCGYYYSLFADT